MEDRSPENVVGIELAKPIKNKRAEIIAAIENRQKHPGRPARIFPFGFRYPSPGSQSLTLEEKWRLFEKDIPKDAERTAELQVVRGYLGFPEETPAPDKPSSPWAEIGGVESMQIYFMPAPINPKLFLVRAILDNSVSEDIVFAESNASLTDYVLEINGIKSSTQKSSGPK